MHMACRAVLIVMPTCTQTLKPSTDDTAELANTTSISHKPTRKALGKLQEDEDGRAEIQKRLAPLETRRVLAHLKLVTARMSRSSMATQRQKKKASLKMTMISMITWVLRRLHTLLESHMYKIWPRTTTAC